MSVTKKKILIATGIFPPEIGGPATYSKLLLEELPQYNFVVTVLPFATVRHLPPVIRHLTYLLKVLQLGSRADIIYAQDPVSVGLPVALANIFLSKRFLLKVVGDFAWEQASARHQLSECLDDFDTKGCGYQLRTKLHIFAQKFVIHQADRIIVPSNYLKRMIGRYLPVHKQDKIKVIYNAFDLEEVGETKEELRTFLGWAGPVIISAGRLVPWKGFSLLIKLMPELIKTFPTIRLVIVGEGEERKRLETLANDLSVSGNVLFAGSRDHLGLLKLIKAADIFALNTNYEGLSHVLLEAMALGTPVVTTPAGGNIELVISGETGVLASFGDFEAWLSACKKILTDKTETDRITQQAQIFTSQNFSREKMIGQLISELR